MKTTREFRYIDPTNKLNVLTVPVGETVTAKHPYFERMKAGGYFDAAKKPSGKKKMTDPDAT